MGRIGKTKEIEKSTQENKNCIFVLVWNWPNKQTLKFLNFLVVVVVVVAGPVVSLNSSAGTTDALKIRHGGKKEDDLINRLFPHLRKIHADLVSHCPRCFRLF